ncbi:Choline-transporter-like protein [Blattamonas nauphoetae]|uniref:Choline transporter-like protein n=1 Tax=Blattamonas nauphoetae TaxID=2049346 RepID=A0ABQ9XED5_9EUKA|nr:Choline-transporter-like protein [Blattamonas nauphoetae]
MSGEFQFRRKYKDQINDETGDDGTVQDKIYIFQRNESCNEVGCIIALLIFAAAYLAFMIVALVLADFTQLTTAVSDQNEYCGFKTESGASIPPYLFTAYAGSTASSFCVKSCPTAAQPCICQDGTTHPAATEDECLSHGSTCFYTANTTYSRLQNLCLTQEQVASTRNSDKSFMLDFVSYSWVIVVVLAVAVIISFLYVCCLSKCGKCVVWCLIVGCVVAIYAIAILCLVFCIICFANGSEYKGAGAALLVIAIVLVLAGFISCCCIYCCIDRIRLVVALIQEAGAAMLDMKCTAVVPIWVLIMAIIVDVIFVATITGFSAAGKVEGGSYRLPGGIVALIVITVFIFILLSYFTDSFGVVWLASIFGDWYFTADKKYVRKHYVLDNLKYTIKKSGSIAFGSFIMAIVRFLRILAEAMEDASGSTDNIICCLIFCCLQCILMCIESIVAFINSQAWMVIGIKGKKFYKAAKEGVLIYLRNILRVWVFEDILPLVIGLGIFFVMLIGIGISILLSSPVTIYGNSAWYLTLIVSIAFTYFSVDIIFNVFYAGAFTILMCFLMDEEKVRSKKVEPYASENLRKHMYGAYKLTKEKRSKKNNKDIEEMEKDSYPCDVPGYPETYTSGVPPSQAPSQFTPAQAPGSAPVQGYSQPPQGYVPPAQQGYYAQPPTGAQPPVYAQQPGYVQPQYDPSQQPQGYQGQPYAHDAGDAPISFPADTQTKM